MKKLFIASLMLFCLFGCSKKEKKEQMITPVSVVKPKVKDVPIYLIANGHMEAYQHVQIQPQVSGLITNIYYQEGDYVQENDLLITIDSRPYIAALQQNEALLAQSTASLKFAEDTLNRNAPLVKEEFVSQNEFDQLETNVATISAQIQENLAQIEEAKINVDYCYITAPISGILGDKLIDIGNLVSQGQDSVLVTLNRIEPIYCSFFIPEKDLYKVIYARKKNKESLKTVISYDLDFKHTFEGGLEFINNEVDENTGMILLKSTFLNKDHILWPGQFLNVRLILREEKGAILIPTEAIQRTTKGAFVFVVEGGSSVKEVPIKLGQQEDEYIIVEEGLKPDSIIVSKGQLTLTEGSKVRIVNGEDVQ